MLVSIWLKVSYLDLKLSGFISTIRNPERPQQSLFRGCVGSFQQASLFRVLGVRLIRNCTQRIFLRHTDLPSHTWNNSTKFLLILNRHPEASSYLRCCGGAGRKLASRLSNGHLSGPVCATLSLLALGSQPLLGALQSVGWL